MVDILSMVDLTSISAMLAAAGVLVGVVFAVLELRNLVKARQTDLVINLYRDFGSKEFQEAWQRIISSEYKDYSDYVAQYGLDEAYRVVMLFEGMGTLVHMKLIDITLVQHLISGPTKGTWEKMRPMIEGHRQQVSPVFCEWFEHLYNELQKREQRLQQIQQ